MPAWGTPVAACAHRSGIVLGQQEMAHKRNRPETPHRLRERLDLQGRVVAGDPRFTQREACRRILPREHYLFAVSLLRMNQEPNIAAALLCCAARPFRTLNLAGAPSQ